MVERIDFWALCKMDDTLVGVGTWHSFGLERGLREQKEFSGV